MLDARNPNRVSSLTGCSQIVNMRFGMKQLAIELQTTYPQYIRKPLTADYDNGIIRDTPDNRLAKRLQNYSVGGVNNFNYIALMYTGSFEASYGNQRYRNNPLSLFKMKLRDFNTGSDIAEITDILQTKGIYGTIAEAGTGGSGSVLLSKVYELVAVPSNVLTGVVDIEYPVNERPSVNKHSNIGTL